MTVGGAAGEPLEEDGVALLDFFVSVVSISLASDFIRLGSVLVQV